ncbi:CLUMA_CG008624, isoform A [Clunio marinus]|uniref:CLUMA_CG008624, isoform A n=1 Tax=Clunio marinus TaxID=568069 RepID=A0A1J1I4M6_9DIPT|nr:CLUMA_CG008624, isoform A [Clunio marinus]
MLKVVIILALSSAVFAQTPVKSCGKGQLLPKAVYFGGKESFCTKSPCVLKRGKTGITEVEFISPINSQSIMPKAKAKVFGMSIDLNLGVKAASACKFLKSGCPLEKGKPALFKLVKPVEKNAMTGTADVEYTLVGDDNQVIFCYKLKTVVV